eukprot:270456-Pleurochrysis_carterae.AAC.1
MPCESSALSVYDGKYADRLRTGTDGELEAVFRLSANVPTYVLCVATRTPSSHKVVTFDRFDRVVAH